MITPRQTRLLRVADLQSFQRVLASLICHGDPFLARSCAVLVPSHAAAGQLRHTLETVVIDREKNRTGSAVLFPDLLTRSDWYERLHERLPAAPSMLNDFEREVMMAAAARQAAEAGSPPPFKLRPGLIDEIVRLYDELQRLRKSVADFERLLGEDLEIDAESDRGAERLLRQTRFLADTFRLYEAKLSGLGRFDEHQLRRWLLDHPLRHPYTHSILTIADRVAEREGLWPADFDLLTRLPRLTRIDVVATEATLAAGFHDRLREALPGIEEQVDIAEKTSVPALLAPAAQPSVEAGLKTRLYPMGGEGGALYFRSRDREDELSDIARRLKQPAEARRSLNRTAIVFKRPLPYIYLAREVFGSAGIPHQTWDTLPLAAEPYAAAIDLVFDFISSDFNRSSTIALLRSPHFTFGTDGRPLGRRAIAAFDRKLAEAGYLGGLERLGELVAEWTAVTGEAEACRPQIDGVARAALAIAESLAPLAETAAAAAHLDRLSRFLRQFNRPLALKDPLGERHLRARAAIQAAVDLLRDAHRAIDDRPLPFAEIIASIRRWIEGHTFAPRAGSAGVHFVDSQAARFGLFDEIHLVGLIDTEWPDRTPRNIFFPPFLLQRHLGWPAEADRLAASRAAFRDLMRLAHERVSVSTFALEDDAIVGPSVFLEDLEAVGLRVDRVPTGERVRVFPHEAISEKPVEATALSQAASAWLALRQSRTDPSAPIFHGTAGAYQGSSFAVGALETYLECPFKFFAKHVLKLEEEQEDEESRRPRQQGQFLHRVFQAFFEEWNRIGRRSITLETLADAREVFARVVTPLLENLPEVEAALERNRLFGTAAAEGLAEIVFRIEAESGADVIERLLEHRLEGEFEIQGPDGPRRVSLTGIADRIDFLEDGTLRIIDYKSGRPPGAKRMLQLPVYSVCATQQLEGRRGRSWKVGEGGYIAFRDPRRFVALGERGSLDQTLRDAQARLLNAIDAIQAGQFPPDPVEPFRCAFCSYPGVCRKDYVGDE